MKDIRSFPSTLVLLAVFVFTSTTLFAQSSVQLNPQPDKNRVQVRIDGELFTNYIVNEYPLPILYPILGPEGVRMNRHYPIKKRVDGESDDHPHHKSLMYTHGDFNGVDFWHQDGPKTVHQDFLKVKGNQIKSRNKWVDENGNQVLADTRLITFRKVPGGRAIDYEITLHATEDDLKIGDTKEGTMSFRTHPNLRIDKGANAINSQGTKGESIWGEPSKWVHYAGQIDEKDVGVAVFDHPTNPRHPSTWHARDYGLITANPFGYSYFLDDNKNGSMTIQEGGDVTFSYRFLFIKGKNHKEAQINKRYQRYASEYTPSYVPEQFHLQFVEHFEDKQSINRFKFSSEGDWSRQAIMNGARHVLQQNHDGEKYEPPHRSPHHIGLVRDTQVSSFLLDFDAKQIGREYNHRDTCVFYNFVDPANYYYTHMCVSRDDHAHQTFIVDDAPRTAITNNPNAERSVDWGDEWHHIRVFRNAKSGEIKIYIDDMDEPEMTANDTTHQSGRIGFGSFDDKARFKNIQLYAASNQNGISNFFESKKFLSIKPGDGHFYHPLTIEIQSLIGDDGNQVIRYTTDGSAPSADSTVYDKPFRIKQETTVKAALFQDGQKISSIRSASFKKLTEDEYKNELHVSDLKVSSERSYELVDNGINEGDALYTDRSYSYTDLPQLLKKNNVSFIRTANDDANISGKAFQVKVNVPATVYVALDQRTDEFPGWLDSYEKTDHVIDSTDVSFRLYKKNVLAGTIQFGSNNAPSMYQVFLTKDK